MRFADLPVGTHVRAGARRPPRRTPTWARSDPAVMPAPRSAPVLPWAPHGSTSMWYRYHMSIESLEFRQCGEIPMRHNTFVGCTEDSRRASRATRAVVERWRCVAGGLVHAGRYAEEASRGSSAVVGLVRAIAAQTDRSALGATLAAALARSMASRRPASAATRLPRGRGSAPIMPERRMASPSSWADYLGSRVEQMLAECRILQQHTF